MRLPPWAIALLTLVVVTSLLPTTIVAAQEVVTLTVTIETPDGEPVANAALTATWDGGSSTATTVSNGKAFIDVEQGADVEIAVEHPDYIRNEVFSLSDARSEAVTITVHPRAAARIRIIDSEGPVPRALITFRKQGQIVRRVATDGNGVVEIGPVEAGNYAVSIRKSRYLTKTVEIELDGEISQDIRIEQGTVPLTVNVTDDYFAPARPIGDATVQVAEVGMVRTQPNGIQQISVPVNIRLDVEISKDGYTTVAQTVNVGEDPLRLRVHLRRTPSLSVEVFSDRVVVGERLLVEVTDEYNDPVANATVRIDGDSVAMTGADGRAAVELTAAGEHEITVTKGEVTSSPTTVIGVASNGATVTTAVGSETEAPGMPGFGVLVAILGILLGGVASRIGRKTG